jgi:diguanylate cyclase
MFLTSIEPSPPGYVEPSRDPRESRLKLVKARMQSDLRLAIVTLFCLCTFLIIGSFGIYRLSIGDWLNGVVDLVIVMVLLALAILAWNPKWTHTAANLVALSASLAGVTVTLLLGLTTMWVFAILVANFLMAQRPVALTVSLAMVGSIALVPEVFVNRIEHLSFIAVASMVSLFSLIFATRVDNQHGQLTEMASRDGLTGAYNRRALDRDLMKLVHSSPKRRHNHCLAILDMDDFKRLNDRHGHEAGDKVLIRLTEIVRSATRKNDRFYRYGGEEFVLLLPDTSLAGARTALINLRKNLARKLAGPDGKVTASFGLARLRPSETPDTWLDRADQALLTAKRKGKNRIEQA